MHSRTCVPGSQAGDIDHRKDYSHACATATEKAQKKRRAAAPPCPPPLPVQMGGAQRQGAPSRGALPVAFVTAEQAPEPFLEGLDSEVSRGGASV